MKDKAHTVRPSGAGHLVSFIVVLLAIGGRAICAQELHIKVLDARNGKPVTNDCVNVFVPGMVDALVVPTDKEGMATLHVMGKHAQPLTGRNRGACSGFATIDPIVGVSDEIQISSVYHVACQEYVDPRSLNRPMTKPAEELMPSYSIAKILASGVTASNTCGKFRAEAKPGELILFVRRRSFWERMRE